MSQAPTPATRPARDGRTRDATLDDQTAGEVLGTLEDGDCRRILEATSEEALSATEIADRCDIPASTVYRKLDDLTAADLLVERTRISPTGSHASEYAAAVEDLQLSVTGDGIEVTLSRESGTADPERAGL